MDLWTDKSTACYTPTRISVKHAALISIYNYICVCVKVDGAVQHIYIFIDSSSAVQHIYLHILRLNGAQLLQLLHFLIRISLFCFFFF